MASSTNDNNLLEKLANEGQNAKQKLQLELYLSDLLSEIFNRRLVAIVSKKISPFQPSRNWFYLLDNSNYEIALDLSPFYATTTQAAFFIELVNLADSLKANFAPNELKVISNFSQASPLHEQTLLIVEKSQQVKPLGQIHFATPFLEQLIENYDTSSEASGLLDRNVNVELTLLHPKPIKCHQHESVNLELSGARLLLSNPISGLQLFFSFYNKSNQKYFIILLENSIMNECKEAFPCCLSLGEIGISMNDLLNLRPGSTITFTKPDNWQGTLQLGNTEWAQVSIQLEEEQLRLTVEDVASIEVLKKKAA